ncbi:MAG: sensor domain-containing diguanylate cyclase [Geminicoccaceae bacterium]
MASLRPPTLVWNPAASTLADPRLQDLLDRWTAMRGANALPPPEFAQDALRGPLADRLTVVDVADGGRELRYRHAGRGIARNLGRVLSGLSAFEVGLPSSDFIAVTYLAVARRGAPLFTEHEPDRRSLISHWRRLVLPCGTDGQVTCIVTAGIAEDPLRTLVDTVSDAVLVIDDARRIRIANPAAERMLGLGEEAMLGEPMASVLAWPGLLPAEPLPERLVGRTTEAFGRRRDGSEFPVEVSLGMTPLGDSRCWVAVIRDISARKASEAEMRRLAYHDPLTGVANRALFIDRLEQALLRARRDRTRIGLIMLDLDRLKQVNDRYGHATGDAVLVGFARRIGTIVRETDLMARLGGDEFAILLTALRDNAGAGAFAARVLARLEAPLVIGDHEHRMSASLGIALSPFGTTPAAELLLQADDALYRAKAEGGGCYRLAATPREARRLAVVAPGG